MPMHAISLALTCALLACARSETPSLSHWRTLQQVSQNAAPLPGEQTLQPTYMSPMMPSSAAQAPVAEQPQGTASFPLIPAPPSGPFVTESSQPSTVPTLQPQSLTTTTPTQAASGANGGFLTASPGSLTGPALAPSPPPPLIGTLTSLLAPPPGFVMPPLSAVQQANLPQLQKLRQGIATVVYQRSVSNYDGVNMNCGLGYLNDYFKNYFVGLPLPLYGTGASCGGCVQVWCVDSICKNTLVANATFMITDSCHNCQGNSLVISAAGAAQLTGVNINDNPSVQIAWTYTSCAPLIQGGIKMLPSNNNSPVFLGLNFSNLAVLIKSVTINGIAMTLTNYGYWTIDTPGQNIPLRAPYSLQLVGVDNQQLQVRLASLQAQDLGVNFSA